MEKIPKPILSIIFSMMPSFDQVAKIATVCRKWKAIVEVMDHSASFQRSDDPRCWSDKNSIFIMAILLEKFTSPYPKIQWKLLYLDLKSLIIKKKDLSSLLLAQPRLLKLDLTNTTINLSNLWDRLYKAKCEAEEKDPLRTIEFSLEELRITNNQREPGHYTLIKLFPNLKRLYAGNTQTNIFDFKKLIKNLPKLEILDISHCPDCQSQGDDYCQKVIKKYLKGSHLKTIFYSYSDIEEAGESNKLNFEEINGVKLINKSICEILGEINDENHLTKLKEWLDLGGDVNLCNEIDNDNEVFTSWRYPHIEFLKIADENMAIKVFKMLLLFGIDLSVSYFVEKSVDKNSQNNSSNSDSSSSDEDSDEASDATESETNPLLFSGMNNNIELFRFFVRNSFPLINEKNILKMPLTISQELFKLYLNHEIPGFFTKNLMIEGLNSYLAVNRNIGTVWAINEATNKEQDKGLIERLETVNNMLIDLSSGISNSNDANKLVFGNFHINRQDECGRTFLMLAAAFGNEEIVDMLYKNGADVNIKDEMGYTALHYAAERGYKKTVEKLLSYGVVASTPAESGTSAIALAKINFHNEIVSVLIKSEKKNFEALNGKLAWSKGKRRVFKDLPSK
ncbi:unnamed protein product [Blepharisma stoltei]|uniref:F-box domain-containing protein n=1 Tax=Blepharisma stoltei TaxID=1481888 RepID=A0AAU9K3P3_9CILI|nr:unnamed protein product [Blepharisma stoltei]